jgi:hypothetical protein
MPPGRGTDGVPAGKCGRRDPTDKLLIQNPVEIDSTYTLNGKLGIVDLSDRD